MSASYQRIFIKLSGESLGHPNLDSISKNSALFEHSRIKSTIKLLKTTHKSGLQVAVMTGAGNIARGRDIRHLSISKPAADQIGMLATLMNSLVLLEYLKAEKLPVKVMSSLRAEGVFESFNFIKAREYLNDGFMVILAGGSGKPLFTTDTAAAVLAIECDCEAIFKLTKVDGVYSKDPSDKDAEFLKSLRFSEAIERKLEVMDLTAFTLCQNNNLPIHICNMDNPNAVIENKTHHTSGSLIMPD